jgi:hypothetical protein
MMLYADAARTQRFSDPLQPSAGYTVLFDTGADSILAFGAAELRDPRDFTDPFPRPNRKEKWYHPSTNLV